MATQPQITVLKRPNSNTKGGTQRGAPLNSVNDSKSTQKPDKKSSQSPDFGNLRDIGQRRKTASPSKTRSPVSNKTGPKTNRKVAATQYFDAPGDRDVTEPSGPALMTPSAFLTPKAAKQDGRQKSSEVS